MSRHDLSAFVIGCEPPGALSKLRKVSVFVERGRDVVSGWSLKGARSFKCLNTQTLDPNESFKYMKSGRENGRLLMEFVEATLFGSSCTGNCR